MVVLHIYPQDDGHDVPVPFQPMLADVDLWGAPWPDTITAIFTVILTGGVYLAWQQLWDARRTRDAEIVHQLMALWDGNRMVEARRLVASYSIPGSGGAQQMAKDYKAARATLKYLRDPKMTPILISRLVGLSAAPLAEVESSFAADSTGFTTSRFERWYDHKWGKERSRHEWVKLHAMTGTKTNVVTSVQLSDGHANDTRFLPALVADTAERFTMEKVTADKAYSSKNNMQVIEDAGAAAYIPFKGGWPTLQLEMMPELHPETSVFYLMKHMFIYQREMFLAHYHCRSNVETTFSMIKRKFGDSLRSKSEVGQYNEILCKVIAHNICVLVACIFEMGLEMPQFKRSANTA